MHHFIISKYNMFIIKICIISTNNDCCGINLLMVFVHTFAAIKRILRENVYMQKYSYD